jgi:hypothetical protein
MFDADHDVDTSDLRRPDHSRNSSTNSNRSNGRVSGINVHVQLPDLRRSLSSVTAQNRATGSLEEEDTVLVKNEAGGSDGSDDGEELDYLDKEGDDGGVSNKAGIILV